MFFLNIELLEQKFAIGAQNGGCIFLIIYKDQ